MKGHCKNCGTEVWAGGEPHPRELVACPRCGADCSTPAPLRYRLGRWWHLMKRQRKLYGLWHALARTRANWRLDREVEYAKQRAPGAAAASAPEVQASAAE